MTSCHDIVPLLGPSLDGELAPLEAARVTGHLQGCEVCRARTALLTAQGSALRQRLERRVDALDLSRFAERVMAQVDADEARPSSWRRLRALGGEEWAAHPFSIGAGAGLALAACLALVVFFDPAAQSRRADAQALAGLGSQQLQASIDELEYDSRDGAVLQLPGQTTVIWLSDEEPGRGGAR